MRFFLSLTLLAIGVPAQTRVTPAPLLPFDKLELTDKFYAEGIAVGDFNRDGKKDVTAGPFWWEGPDFRKQHKIKLARSYPIGGFSDEFFSFVADVDKDGWDDVVTVGFPGRSAQWYRNPRTTGPLWKKHEAWPWVGGEAPALLDIDRDGTKELVCASLGYLSYLVPNAQDPTKPWVPHLISKIPGWSIFTHGMGLGDVNGDGRLDLITSLGWFEQPPSLQGDPEWVPHPAKLGSGGAQMFAYDVDGDGDNDIVSSIVAHGYGLSWFEHVKSQSGDITFREHVIQKSTRDASDKYQFSQPHGLAIGDIDGDGLIDIVTGKRYWPHLGRDPGAREPRVLYWFKLVRQGGVRFVPQRIDGDSGVGVEVGVEDLDGDGKLDVFAANKYGVYLHLQSK